MKKAVERFRKRFVLGCLGGEILKDVNPKKVESFISHEISNAKKEVVGEIEKYLDLSDKYEYRGKTSPQKVKELTLMFVRDILKGIKERRK